ncbi:MAG: DUF1015 domain-containing protein [Robiginitalea sp.]|uniref:DUF1015 domain-containing protein n=1 Tax=Robiginitalea sp. TaxID=1902411 RepID=UPI003C758C6C
MAEVIPFQATRPAPDKVASVVSRSYDQYGAKERKAVMAYNPFSFLHIIDPGFKFHKAVQGEQRFSMVRNRYLEFLEEGILIREETPSYYLYRTQQEDYSTYGVFCATSTADYRRDVIRKHEETLSFRETLFADYLQTVKFNAEPVLLTYPDQPDLDALFANIMGEEPEYFFTTTDRITHQLWVISNPEQISEIREGFKAVKTLYIADGHHRSASSDLLARRMQKGSHREVPEGAYGSFMSYLIPESQLRIRSFSRLLSGVGNRNPDEILIGLDRFFRIQEKGSTPFEPTEKHQFSMYLSGLFYGLKLRKHSYRFSDPLDALDSQILYKTVLEPLFGVTDLRHDSRIHYMCARMSALKIKKMVDKGVYDIGFGMTPVNVGELKAISDAGLKMPPKSTFIEPKLPSGLTIYDFQNPNV